MLELIFDAYSLGAVLQEHTALIPQDMGTEEFGRQALTSLDMTRFKITFPSCPEIHSSEKFG